MQTFITLSVSWPAAIAFGKVLLQTAPSRGLLSGRMESFLKVMKEVRLYNIVFAGSLALFVA
jgi:hypothetical protein